MSAPYHPATNGLVEKTVRTFKESANKLKKGDMQMKLGRLLFSYNTAKYNGSLAN